MMRLYLRLANIVFSKEFINTLRNANVIPTRRNKFKWNSIVINHGNSKPINIGNQVNTFYLLNKPEAIRYCSNKLENYKILKEFYPLTYNSINEVKEYPVIVKPLVGHHGYGVKRLNNYIDLYKFLKFHKDRKYIIQQIIPIKHEFRFNVLDREVFQISHKERMYENGIPLKTENGGMVFCYRSLGNNAQISDNMKLFISKVIDKFHKFIGYSLADYCIDLMKGTDNKYYLSELNSAYGIGSYTIKKLLDVLYDKYENDELEPYRIR